jgi:hypothetical protein
MPRGVGIFTFSRRRHKMRAEPNVEAFCRALRKHGLTLLDGVDTRLQGIIDQQLRHSEMCYSESITADLESAWDDGPLPAVSVALESYLHVIREWLEGILGPDSLFSWCRADVTDEQRWELYYSVDLIQLREVSEVASALVAAASEPDVPQSN